MKVLTPKSPWQGMWRGFYTDAGGQGRQLGVPQGTMAAEAAAGWEGGREGRREGRREGGRKGRMLSHESSGTGLSVHLSSPSETSVIS